MGSLLAIHSLLILFLQLLALPSLALHPVRTELPTSHMSSVVSFLSGLPRCLSRSLSRVYTSTPATRGLPGLRIIRSNYRRELLSLRPSVRNHAVWEKTTTTNATYAFTTGSQLHRSTTSNSLLGSTSSTNSIRSSSLYPFIGEGRRYVSAGGRGPSFPIGAAGIRSGAEGAPLAGRERQETTDTRIVSFSPSERLREVSSCCISRLRNFSIIAHVDHGKSSVSDAILRKLGSIDSNTRTQFLDSLGKPNANM